MQATYNSACQIGSENLSYQQSTDGNINDFLNKSCGSVVYQGATYASQFYEDYVKSGRILVCDCDGTQSTFNIDCSGESTDIGECLSNGFINPLRKNAMVCLEDDINNCKSIKLTCTAQGIADANTDGTATAYGSDEKSYSQVCSPPFLNCKDANICQGIGGFGVGQQTFCKNGSPSYDAGKVYVKSCGVLRPLNSDDCNHFCV